MPNWCYNRVTIEHDDAEKIAKLLEAIKEKRFFNHIVPMPEAMRNTVSPSAPNHELLNLYGASNWYDWSIAHWGTKWEARVEDIEEDTNCLNLYFETAWGPPIQVYDAMLWQGFRVECFYTEEGMGFAGVYKDGRDLCFDMGVLYDAKSDPEADALIAGIGDEDLRILVEEEYGRYLDMKEEYND